MYYSLSRKITPLNPHVRLSCEYCHPFGGREGVKVKMACNTDRMGTTVRFHPDDLAELHSNPDHFR